MATLQETLREIAKLFSAQKWAELKTRAIAGSEEHPTSADLPAYVSHAMRQLGELEDGFAWAVRARAIDPTNLFAINRVSLLANLTGRFEEAYTCVDPVLDRAVTSEPDRQNLAVTIVNSIHAASKLDKIAAAVERFTPAIRRLDHPDLHFNSACLYALAGDREHALLYVAKSLATGKPKTAFADSDFDRVRDDPRFAALLARDWQAENAALKRANRQSRDQLVPEDFFDVLAPGAANHRRHAELELAIDASVDEVHGYDVYSDWLQAEGDARGLFILASKRCDAAVDESERMLAYVAWANMLAEHSGEWLGRFAPYANRSRWRWGFVRDLVFDTGYSDGSADDVGALFAETLALPVCRFVRSLAIGDVWCDEHMGYGAIVDVLRDAWPPHLRALQIAPGDFQMSWTSLDISELANDHLESLVLGAGDLTLGGLQFPALRRLAIRTGGFTEDNLADLVKAKLPLLDELELWFGDPDYGAAELSPGDLAPLLARRYRRLGLANANFTDELVPMLAGWRDLPHLTHLDLSMGTLGDTGTRALIDHAPRFAHLAVLDLRDNAIPDGLHAELRAVLPNVEIGKQKARRYVSVGE